MKNSNYFLVLLLVLIFSCKKKEDLSSFALMNTKIEESIENSAIINSTLLDVIYNKAKSNKDFVKLKENADKVHEISSIFSNYLESLKSVIKEKGTTKFVDEYFFNDQEIADGGEEFLNYIENYKSSLISTVVLSNPSIAGMIKSTFDIGNIEDRKGKQTDWLTLNFKSFPAIASVIKLSKMQADVKLIEKNFHESLLNVKLESTIRDKDLNIKKDYATLEKPTKEPVKETPKKKKETVKKPIKKKKQIVKPKPEPVVKPKPIIKSKFHIVKKGETVYQISKKYGLTTVKIKKMNGMTNNNLVIGQKLKVAN